jgi:hypothetical protein
MRFSWAAETGPDLLFLETLVSVLSQKYLETTACIFGTAVKLKVINVLREFLTSKLKDC